MKIKRSELVTLIESYLNEEEQKGKYAIYFGARSFNPSKAVAEYLEDFDAGHAWIMVKKPGEGITSYSGKSGAAFETHDFMSLIEIVLASADPEIVAKALSIDDTGSTPNVSRELANWFQGLVSDGELTNDEGERYQTIIQRLTVGRDASQDEMMARMQSLKDQGLITIEEYKNILKDSNWGPLRKLKNYEPDTFAAANSSGNYIISVMPRKNESQEDVKKAIEKIESAFENYNEDVPYDPIPGSNDSVPPDARNSNSFAYTLLRHIFGTHKNVEDRINYKDIGMRLPGWGKFVNGLRP